MPRPIEKISDLQALISISYLIDVVSTSNPTPAGHLPLISDTRPGALVSTPWRDTRGEAFESRVAHPSVEADIPRPAGGVVPRAGDGKGAHPALCPPWFVLGAPGWPFSIRYRYGRRAQGCWAPKVACRSLRRSRAALGPFLIRRVER